ncbi:MAG: hypothetical protein ACI9M3_001383 [Bacteroidia bacterium]|jgi:hypothetical protein
MPYIHINKETDQHRLFGSLPTMCKQCDINYSSMQYQFGRLQKAKFETEDFKIVKVELERNGSNA